jgi:hypothetical protein
MKAKPNKIWRGLKFSPKSGSIGSASGTAQPPSRPPQFGKSEKLLRGAEFYSVFGFFKPGIF